MRHEIVGGETPGHRGRVQVAARDFARDAAQARQHPIGERLLWHPAEERIEVVGDPHLELAPPLAHILGDVVVDVDLIEETLPLVPVRVVTAGRAHRNQ